MSKSFDLKSLIIYIVIKQACTIATLVIIGEEKKYTFFVFNGYFFSIVFQNLP